MLVPATKSEEVTVTATRSEQRMSDVPASVSVLNRADIKQSPAVLADDVLRQIPSFSLFRRTSSVAAHPATQGVSLRGIGPSGVSRTLVLLDGIPFNDPFGGWVAWSRVPLEGAERIEVIEGASSSLYGNYAMGGLINIVTMAPARRTLQLRTQYGNLRSPKIDVHASDVWGRVGVAVDAGLFDTDGYPTVVADERGVIDGNSTASFKNLNVKLDYAATDRVRAFVRGSLFREERNNGKITTFDPLTDEANDTTWKTASGGLRMRLPDQSEVQATVFADVETFRSNNVAVPNTVLRNIGRLSLMQTVPSSSVGGMVQWARPITGVHLLTAGMDWRWTDGDSEERVLDATTGTTVTVERVSGGTQRSVGFYFQDLITPLPKVTIVLSARLDRWRNYDGHNLETVVATGEPTPGHNPALPERRDTVASPRAAALFHLTPRVTLWGALGGWIPCPHAERALPRIPGRHDPDAGQPQPWARAARRRRSGHQPPGASEPHLARDGVRQPGAQPRLERDHRPVGFERDARAAEPRAHADLGGAERRRVSPRLRLAFVRCVLVRRLQGDRGRCTTAACRRRHGALDARRQVPCAGAAASRVAHLRSIRIPGSPRWRSAFKPSVRSSTTIRTFAACQDTTRRVCQVTRSWVSPPAGFSSETWRSL